jgi:hypothetical protein
MKEFLNKILIASTLLLGVGLFFTIRYIQIDPYQDLRKYDNYSWTYYFQSLGDISTKKLLNSSIRYESFIFGSSRTVSLWACYAQQKFEGRRTFHYGNWNETIGGMHGKIKLLDSLGYDLTDVILYIDTDYTFEGDGTCRPYDHYIFTKTPKLQSLYSHYVGFMGDPANLNILLWRDVDPSIFVNKHSDPVTNDRDHVCSDSLLRKYGEGEIDSAYLAKIDSLRRSGFLQRRPAEQKFMESVISESERRMIEDIVRILDKHHSKAYVLLTPLYDQLKFSASDMSILRNAFGDRLYDFSGINPTTQAEYNYYDRKHFLDQVSKMMIDEVIKPGPAD